MKLHKKMQKRQIDIQFDADANIVAKRSCPICRSEERHPLLGVRNGPFHCSDLHMARCLSCGTAYFVDEDPVVGYNYKGFDEDYWFNYVQNGAGISAMLEPLLAVNRPRQGRLLDVGCGFGFVPHFWHECGFGTAVGLESSSYGSKGAEKLGVHIIPSYYADADELRGEKFDYVFSSEVIEHVEDPAAFVTEISAALADDGILVLTTPSATALVPESPYILLLATLSPGFHYFIASRQGLIDLLSRCGFGHVVVRDLGHRLFAWASHKPLPDIAEGFTDWPLYLDYLERLAQAPDPHVASGAMYRALKDSTNLGRREIAERIYPHFEALARDHFGLDFQNVAASNGRRRARRELDNATFPSWMGCGFLYAGLTQKALGASLYCQEALFAAAIETMQQEIMLGAQFAGEPAHFIDLARHAHAEVTAALAASTDTRPDPMQSYVLRYPGDVTGRDICLVAIYAPQGRVTAATAAYLELLASHNFVVVACIAVNDAAAEVELSNMPSTHGIAVRQNGGMDFSAWACALKLMPECWAARRLIFTNDSIVALPTLFAEFVNRLRGETADYVALTESHQIQYHTQSYFFMLQGAALTDSRVETFWNGLPMLANKKDIIREYEVRMIERVTDDWGLSHKVLFSLQDLFPLANPKDIISLNVSHTYWEHLIYSGMPFVKVELLRDNPLRLNILHWRSVLARYGVNIDQVEDHMNELRSKKGAEQKAPQSEWRIILKELNRVRLNARRRRKARRSAQENP